LRDVGRLGDGSLQTLQNLGIESLSTGNGHLHLAPRSRHDLGKLVADATQQAEAVVDSKGVEEVLDSGTTRAACLLGQLGNDVGLVRGGQRRRGQNGRQLGVPRDDGAQVGEGFRCRVEGG
jgi:hypothetical protein